MNYYTTNSGPFDYVTGKAPAQSPGTRDVTEKEKVSIWYIDQIEKMSGDDAFVFLIVSFPLIEAIIRLELEILDENDVCFGENSPALKWLAKFLTIPETNAREFWDSFRNGLMHRAMIKNTLPYSLTGKKAGRPAEVKNGITHVYVWELKDALIAKLKKHHKKLFANSASLPGVHING